MSKLKSAVLYEYLTKVKKISRRYSKMDIPENIFFGRLFVCLHC